MALEIFQQKTVDAAVKALSENSTSRRFLIADEVGLGKTIAARAVAKELAEQRTGPFNVLYFCPSLEIASQNLTKFLALDSDWDRPEDRLSLVASKAFPKSTKFRIFSYTPDTSIPGWKGGMRTGRDAERQLIASLTNAVAPRFWRRLRLLENKRKMDWEAAHATEPRGYWPENLPEAPPGLRRPFEQALRAVFELRHKPLESGLRSWLIKHRDGAEYILRARSALSLAALTIERTRPHLLILDEFHRYADLIKPDQAGGGSELAVERKRVTKLLIDTLFGEQGNGPAVLLLSATPYRLMRADGGALPGGRYDHLIQLVEFLYGKGGVDQASRARQAIVRHHQSLETRSERAEALTLAKAAKQGLEAILRPVIARTERATSIKGDLFDRRRHPAPIASDDLEIFQHFAKAVDQHTPDLRGWVLPLWTSVPYPAETLFDYKVGSALKFELPRLTSPDTPSRKAAHPQLRAMVTPDDNKSAPIKSDMLSFPWLPPTRPWWELGGRWSSSMTSEQPTGKALLFSRYIATPKAVSALLSADVDRDGSRKQEGTSKFSAQAYLRFDPGTPGPLLAMFLPWPKLSSAPIYVGDRSISSAKAQKLTRQSFRKWLGNQGGVSIIHSKRPPRKIWKLAFEVETALGGGALLKQSFRSVAALKGADLVGGAPVACTLTITEADLLSDWLFSTPGAIVGRSLCRHQPEALTNPKAFVRAFKFSWTKLRLYLGQRYFAGAILRAGKGPRNRQYPEALRRALVDGGFEAVLDEHLAVMALVGDQSSLDYLEGSIITRPGQVRFRKGKNKRPGHGRVHAAMPFAGAGSRGGNRTEEIRSDGIRKAFNSPFWPHVLTTTSVGQEGLDFHIWCDRVVHWDLPRDPVDFEQREGRVDRYGSLSVRRALAEDFGGSAFLSAGVSPFNQIFERARAAPRTALGLERWWSPTNHKPRSFTFEAQMSSSGIRFDRLRDDLMRYRLALGQPEPGLFEQFVKHFELSRDEVRGLALNLSPSNEDQANQPSVICPQPIGLSDALHQRQDADR
ncbi:hypothetical protein E0H36_18520 [Rhizobium leguminosarum bv. viciae]|uniref:DEAD/DEAH box helicase n=1 Tax=Rhizobium leguminosarum TaxID=384 RepID=UPI0010322F3E|nr:DEAD/DEAH box helicase [Rhizobium leguminosarum]MBY5485202.1 DEAD/DEAH box helicase family protein [Rhizobium leguminosarum]TAY88135.1 hypothetical protein ELH83_10045 [Rhizobium leguminosarum]TBZ31236.1 hypothetical protein E0H36_18520 [Rhizobium leguminosarum bv. viciae]